MSMPAGRKGHFEGLDALIKQEKAAAKGLADLARNARQASEAAKATMLAVATSSAAATSSSSSPVSSTPASSAPGAEVAGLASRIGAEVRNAEQPLVAFGAHIDAIFDRVGGTIIEGFRRADAHVKFPVIDEKISQVKAGLSGFLAPGKKGAQALDTSLAGVAKTLKEIADGLKGIGSQAGATTPILAEMTGVVQKAKAPTDQLFDSVGMIKKAWEGVLGAAKQAVIVPPAGKRPGRGRTIPLPKEPEPTVLQTALSGIVQSTSLLARDFNAIGQAGTRAFNSILGEGKPLREVLEGLMVTPLIFARSFATLAGKAVGAGHAIFRMSSFWSSVGDVAGKTFSAMYKGLGGLKLSVAGATKSIVGLSASLAKASVTAPFRVANSSAQTLVGSLRRVGVEALAAFGIFSAASQAMDFFKTGVKGASDLAEAVSANSVTFGNFASKVEGQADAMAKAYGLNKREQLEIANGFGEMAQGAGASQEASAKFAVTFGALAADLSSFKNIPFADAARDIQSALAGQSEPLRKFGVMIDEDTVKAYALSHGLAKSADDISNSAKMTARAALIQRGLSSATGDLARTSDSAANTFRKSSGGLENFGVAVGSILMPAITSAAKAFNELLASVTELLEANKPLIESWVGYVKSGFDQACVYIRNAGLTFQILRVKAYEALVNIGELLEVVVPNLQRFASYVSENWCQLIVAGLDFAGSAFHAFVENLSNVGTAFAAFLADPTQGFNVNWTPFTSSFKVAVAQLPELIRPELTSMKGEVDKLYAEMNRREDELKAKAKKAPAAGKREALDDLDKDGKSKGKGKKKKDGDEFSELAEAGSKEAYSAIVRHQFGTRDDGMKTVAKEAPRQTELLKGILDAAKAAGRSGGIPGLETLTL